MSEVPLYTTPGPCTQNLGPAMSLYREAAHNLRCVGKTHNPADKQGVSNAGFARPSLLPGISFAWQTDALLSAQVPFHLCLRT